MGRQFLAGRDLTWTDIYGFRPVAIVSENLAREYWGSPAAAIGKRVREGMKDDWREIIGVVANEYDDGVQSKAAHDRLLAGPDEEFLGKRDLRRGETPVT